jgi:hypothetical protein
MQKMYMLLARGWGWDEENQTFQDYSTVKYTLPDYFQDLLEWNKRGNGWQAQWDQEMLVHIGEEFNYTWVPVGMPELWTQEEYEEYHSV